MRVLILILYIFTSIPASAATKFSPLNWLSQNGARVIFYQAMEVPILDVSVAFAAGSAYDGNAFGLSALTTRLLNQGNGGLNADIIAEQLAQTGAQLQISNDQDMVVLSLKSLTQADALSAASAIFAKIITQADFPMQAFVHEKNQQLSAIEQSQESPDEIATKLFYRLLYNTHPYAHPVIGESATLKSLKIIQVQDFYRRFFVSNNAVIVIVGAIDQARARLLAEELSKKLPQGTKAAAIAPATALTAALDVEFKFPSSQAVIRLGQLGISYKDNNYFPLIVANYIFGGGTMTSILARELREKRGLTYGIYSNFDKMASTGIFVIAGSTKNNKAKSVITLIRAALVDFIKTGATLEELLAAKKYLSGSFVLAKASNHSIAAMLLQIAFYDLDQDFLQNYVARINEVSLESMKNAMQQLIKPDNLLQVSVGRG